MLITDTNYIIRDVNHAGTNFLGYSREELVGNTPAIFFSDSETFYTDVINTVARGEAWTGYFETKTKDGKMYYGRGSAIPLEIDGE
ncbi:MAG: PAS domain-containing protein, partial [Halobacteria archaeon]|nr:PAS domain-containing protein [Halobacteria archaeon]